MTDIDILRGRHEMPGGHRGYFDRSRSRDFIIGRGEEYGRIARDEKREQRGTDRDPKIRGKDDTPAGAGPEKEMYG
jgi:hypothetical protein